MCLIIVVSLYIYTTQQDLQLEPCGSNLFLATVGGNGRNGILTRFRKIARVRKRKSFGWAVHPRSSRNKRSIRPLLLNSAISELKRVPGHMIFKGYLVNAFQQ